MAYLTGKTKGGKDWTPRFVDSIDPEKCIGCGRCYKACSRNVLGPTEIYDEENDTEHMVMTIVTGDNCIGCVGCLVTCPKKCFTLVPLEI